MKIPFIVCHHCGKQMLPVWFIDEEEEIINGSCIKTGRKRKAVSHFECPYCNAVECVDDSLDEPWR